MEYTQISYQRIKNLGNYESERVELIANVSPDENINIAFDSLKSKANELLGIVPQPRTVEDEDGLINF